MNCLPRIDHLRSGAFTLVEVALSIGIMAVALVPLMALLPIGMDVNRRAVDTTVEAQIIQRIAFSLQQTDYSRFDTLADGAELGPYYFDDQGTEVEKSDDARLYDVLATLVRSPDLPSTAAGNLSSTRNMVRVKLDFAANPGDKTHGELFAEGSNAVRSNFIIVARND